MNDFREWLSDNLRYIMLIGAIALVACGLFFGIRGLTRYFRERAVETSVVEVETQSTEASEEISSEPVSEPVSHAEVVIESSAESVAEAAGEESRTTEEAQSTLIEAETLTEEEAASAQAQAEDPAAEEARKAEEERQASEAAEAERIAAEAAAESERIAAEEAAAYEREHRETPGTILSLCRLRSSAGYDSDILWEDIPVGTQLVVIGDTEAGWLHVRIGDAEGYVGHQFVGF